MHPIRTITLGIILGSLSALTSCASKPPRVIDAALLPYVESFEARYGVKYDGDAIIRSIEESKAGVCSITPVHRTIVINKIYYDRYNNFGLEELMYHELGHCALGLDHSNNKDEYGCPMSIMFYAAFGNSWCYVDRREMLLQELEDLWKNTYGK